MRLQMHIKRENTSPLRRRRLPGAGVQPIALGLVAALLIAPAFPAIGQSNDDEDFVVVRAGRIITVSGKEIENGEIVIVDGTIRLVGRDLEYPGNARIIDAGDQVVMPGLIHARSRMSLPNYNRNGVHTNYNVGDDFDLGSLDFEDVLRAGFTAVCLYPPGTGLPGMATVYRAAGPDEARVISAEAFLRVTMTNPGRDKGVLRGAFKKAKSEIEKVEKARKEWEEKQKAAKAKSEQEKKEPQEKDGEEKKDQPGNPRGENGDDGDGDKEKDTEETKDAKPEEFKPPSIDAAHQRLVDLIRKDADYPLLLEVSNASGFRHAIDAMKQYPDIGYKLFLASGFGSDYHYVIDALADSEIPLLTTAVLGRLPDTATQFNLPGELTASGIEVALVPGSGNFRTVVADLVRAGFDRNSALRAISLQPATFLGVADRLGTIEKDKDADLVFLDGDPLDPLSEVQRVMILGEIVWEKDDK